MGVISTLVVALTATTSDFEKGLEKASKQLDRFAGRFEQVGGAMALGITAPLAALAEESVRFATDFEESMDEMIGSLGQTRSQLDTMRESVLRLAGATAQGPRELAKGLNGIEQAGLRGEAALEVLRVSAKAATIGLADMKTVSTTLTAAMNAYGPGAVNAAQATSVLLAAVQNARVGGTDFLGAFQGLLPLAASLGVSIDQLAAAMTVMTRSGLDAGKASGALRSVLSSIEKPTGQAAEALAEMGLTSKDLRDQLQSKGLLSVLQTLAAGFRNNESAVTRIFPNMRALAGVMSLLGANAGSAQTIFDQLANTTSQKLNKTFAEVADGPGFKFKQALTEIQVLLVRIGDDILPRLLPMVQAFAAGIELAADKVARLSPETQSWVLGLLATAAAIGPVLLGFAAFYNALSTLAGGLALAWRVGSIVLGGLGSLLVGLVGAFNNLAVVFDALEPALLAAFGAITGPGLIAFGLLALAAVMIGSKWQELKTDLSIIFSWIADQVRDTFVGKILDYLGRFASYAADLLSRFGVSIKVPLMGAWDGLVGGVTGAVSSAKTGLESGLSGMLSLVAGWGARMRQQMAELAGGGPKPKLAGAEPVIPGMPPAPTQKERTSWDQYKATIVTDLAGARAALLGLRATMKDATESYNQQAHSMTNATAQSMGAITAAFAQGSMSIGSFIDQMAQAILKLIAKIMLLKALTAVGLGGPFAAGFIGGMFADGGRPPMGKASIVGERGPELFVPDTAGTVVPLEGRMGGGLSVKVDMPVSVSGADVSDPNVIKKILAAQVDMLRGNVVEAVRLAQSQKTAANKTAGRTV
jgi:TP901 family phage tail tape measure protein